MYNVFEEKMNLISSKCIQKVTTNSTVAGKFCYNWKNIIDSLFISEFMFISNSFSETCGNILRFY